MPTPDEIRERRFAVAMPGYDVEEVREFLDEVATRVEEGPTVPRAERFPEIGAAATRVLEAADAAASELVAHGERRAQEIEAAAQQRADEVVREAEARAQEVLGEAQRRLADAEEVHREAEERSQGVTRRRRELERAHRDSVELVGRAAEELQRLLDEAAEPRRALTAALEDARSLLEDGFGDAARRAADRLQRAEEVADELESTLDLPPRRTAPSGPQPHRTAPRPDAGR